MEERLKEVGNRSYYFMKSDVSIVLSKAVHINRFTSLAPRLLCLQLGLDMKLVK